jgi:hypothetical protein
VITSISQTLTSSVSSSSLNKTATAASQDEATAARLEKAAALGTSFEDPSLGAATIVDLSSVTKPKVDPYGPLRLAQQEDAGRSMDTIKKELGKIDAMVAKRRPELAGNWDFQLVDGKFKVTGLNADDAKWLEKKLNSNTALKGAAQAFVSTAVQNLQASGSNPARQEFNYVTGNMENYTFYDVKSQLTEKLSFRALLTQSDQVYDSNKINLDDNARGTSGLSVVATMLTASNQPIEGRQGSFYATKYDPLQG